MILETNGVELHFDLIGEGEPLLWLHGFMGAGSDWQYVFPEAPDGFQVIAPDLRGHGGSSNPSDRFLFRDAAEDVRALLRHLGIARVKAIGVSGGGIVLLHMATAAPDSVSSMVIVSAPPYFPAEARAIQRQMSRSMLTGVELESMRTRHRRGDAQISELIAQARAFADSYDDVNFTAPYLGTITAETLIVFGDRDPFYPVSLAFELRAAIPRSSLWVMPDAGHAPAFGEHAAAFAERALAFLRRPVAR
ncbi:MAG TPA: alpha/beta hydrolase [Gemmatimonadaceae bacterium]|jgi:pimeloyl-ACP methyl ester carboxylesterase